MLPQLYFKARATAEQQVVDCNETEKSVCTQASLTLEFDEGLTCVQYDLSIKDGKRIKHAALYLGRAGKTGPEIASLLWLPCGKNIDGSAGRGFITNADLDTSKQELVINIASLLDAIRNGKIYYAISTEQFPNGIVRGQIFGK